MLATGMPSTTTSTVAATTALSDSGMLRCRRGSTVISSATKVTTPRLFQAWPQSAWLTTCQAATRVRSPGVPVVAKVAGSCCRKMMAAIPRVNPSITGHGMNVTARPNPVAPAASTMSPPSTVTRATLPTPCRTTIGASTTAIAPVGPDT